MDNKKMTWTTPTLVSFGTVESLTAKDKHSGATDGYTFNGNPISG